MKTKSLKKVTIIMLVIAIVVMQISALAITLAWFTDKKTDQKILDLGNIKLKAGENGTSTSMGITLTRADGTTVATKALPGDKIKVTIGVELESTSKPAYYLVYLDDAGMFSSDIKFFFKNGDTVYVTDGTTTNKLNADGTLDTTTSTEVVGKIEANQTHKIEFIQQIDKTKTEVDFSRPKQLACTVFAVQQANITQKDAYTEIYNNYDKEYGTVTFGTGALVEWNDDGTINENEKITLPSWREAIPDFYMYEKIGFYKTGKQPGTLSLNSSLTTAFNEKQLESDKGKIKVYTKGNSKEELAFVSDNKIEAPENCSLLFSPYSGDSSIDIDTSNVNEFNFSNFYTSNVTDMSGMFMACSSLTSLDLRSFDTSKVTNMSAMFSICISLTSLDLSSFDTSKVTNMSSMFTYCVSLTSLDLSSFNTSKVTNMRGMFNGTSLTNLDLSNFDTSNVTDMSYMFYESSPTNLDLSSFNTSKVTNMRGMFHQCSLTSLDLSNFDTSNVTDMSDMFGSCSSLTSLDLSSFDTSNVTNMAIMFSGCFSNNPSGSELKIGDKFKRNGTVVTEKSTLVSNTSLNSSVKVTKNGVELS